MAARVQRRRRRADGPEPLDTSDVPDGSDSPPVSRI